MRSAYLFGVSRQTPLNTFITINFREVKGNSRGAWPADYKSATKAGKAAAIAASRDAIVASIRKWCQRQQPAVPFAAVYVLENAPKGGMGPHIHLLLHLPTERYGELRRSLENNIRKTMGWVIPPLKTKLAELQAERERLLAEHCSVKGLFLPFFFTSSKDNPGGPLSSPEQAIRLAYMCKTMQGSEVVTISGVTQTIDQHIDGGAEITLEPAGNVRVAKRAGALGLLTQEHRATAGWDDATADDLSWLDRRVAKLKLRNEVSKFLNAYWARPSVPADTTVPPSPTGLPFPPGFKDIDSNTKSVNHGHLLSEETHSPVNDMLEDTVPESMKSCDTDQHGVSDIIQPILPPHHGMLEGVRKLTSATPLHSLSSCHSLPPAPLRLRQRGMLIVAGNRPRSERRTGCVRLPDDAGTRRATAIRTRHAVPNSTPSQRFRTARLPLNDQQARIPPRWVYPTHGQEPRRPSRQWSPMVAIVEVLDNRALRHPGHAGSRVVSESSLGVEAAPRPLTGIMFILQ